MFGGKYTKKRHLHFCKCLYGGDKEIRTLDPLLAKQVLSHLSYTPMGIAAYVKVSLAGTLKIEQS